MNRSFLGYTMTFAPVPQVQLDCGFSPQSMLDRKDHTKTQRREEIFEGTEFQIFATLRLCVKHPFLTHQV